MGKAVEPPGACAPRRSPSHRQIIAPQTFLISIAV
jgi:hypothetical protein